MLPTHRLVETYQGYEIWQRQPGFEFTPVMLGKIASYLVRWDVSQLAVFAFQYSLLERLHNPELSEEQLLAAAQAVMRRAIDRAEIQPRTDSTYTYDHGAYVEVSAPLWWLPTFL